MDGYGLSRVGSWLVAVVRALMVPVYSSCKKYFENSMAQIVNHSCFACIHPISTLIDISSHVYEARHHNGPSQAVAGIGCDCRFAAAGMLSLRGLLVPSYRSPLCEPPFILTTSPYQTAFITVE